MTVIMTGMITFLLTNLFLILLYNIQTSAPVPPTPSPTNQPVDASCGLCVQDTSTSCTSNADCPEVPSGGTCTQGTFLPIGSSCTTNGDCGRADGGKPSNRGVCQVETAPGECDPNLCPPTKSPTPLPTNAPTNSVSVLVCYRAIGMYYSAIEQ